MQYGIAVGKQKYHVVRGEHAAIEGIVTFYRNKAETEMGILHRLLTDL